MKRPKNIELSEDTIEAITIEAVKKKTNFKNYVENHLDELAKKLNSKAAKPVKTR